MPGFAANTSLRIGPFVVETPLTAIGHEGLGGIYRARDTRVNRPVFLKIRDADAAARRALILNGRAAASFVHPHLVRILEIGEDQALSQIYVISEHVEGRPLRTILSARRYSARRSLAAAIELAETFADLQEVDLVHGDLSPDEIIVTPRGDAKVLHAGLIDRRGGTAGAPMDGYTSPERAAGGPVDARSDVFSLGAILFAMLVGKAPDCNGIEPVHHVCTTIRPSEGLDAAVSAELCAALCRALAPDPSVRCGSAAAFAAELRAIVAIVNVRAGIGVRRSRG